MGSYDYILAEKLVVPTQNLRYAQENLAGAQRSYEQNRARYNEYVSFKSSLDSLLGNLNSAYGKLGEALEYKKEGYSSNEKKHFIANSIEGYVIGYSDEIEFLYKLTYVSIDKTKLVIAEAESKRDSYEAAMNEASSAITTHQSEIDYYEAQIASIKRNHYASYGD